METVHWSKLEEWRAEHPNVKEVKVDHEEFGFATLIFNYSKPGAENIPAWARHGQYDCWGDLHFIDEEGTLHICHKPSIPGQRRIGYRYPYRNKF